MSISFTRDIPPIQFGAPPEWVAVRFDVPDLRGPLNPSGIQMIADRFPGEWKWCKISELIQFVMSENFRNPEAAQDQSAENLRLRKIIEQSNVLFRELIDDIERLRLRIPISPQS